jgi:hypothetical protein
MTDVTTTVTLDQNSDFVYEVDVTSKVLDLKCQSGRKSDTSAAQIGTCSFKLNNAAGTYTPLAGGNAIRPRQGVQLIVDSQTLWTGFVRRVGLDPSGDQKVMTVEAMDWLGVLSRIDVSRPLMRDVRSDILAHRIVDGAEVGESVLNWRFTDATAGQPDDYIEQFGAVITQESDTPLFEGSYTADIYLPLATTSKVVQQVTARTDADINYVLSAYVRAPDENDVGNQVRVYIYSTGGTTFVGAWHTLTEEYERITVTGDFDGGAGGHDVGIDMNQDAANVRVGAFHLVKEIQAVPRDFDAGQSRFAYVAPRRMKALAALREIATNEGGYIYVNGAGTLMFEDRCHRWRETASLVSQGTVTETMVAMPYEEDIDDLVGEVEFGFMHYEVGAAGKTVFGLYPMPRSIPPNGTLTIDIDYGAIVRDPTTPVANTDYTITDGAGTDETGNVTLAFEDYGGGAQAVFTSAVAYTTYLESFKIRATPVRPSTDNAQVTYTPASPPDVASKIRYSFRLLSSRADAQARAEWTGMKYVTQRSRLPVTLVNKSAALVTQMTERAISDRVTLENDTEAYSAKITATPHHIEAIEHRLDFGKKFMETAWLCTPVWNKGTDEQYYWRLDTGELGDAATVTTTTALGP